MKIDSATASNARRLSICVDSQTEQVDKPTTNSSTGPRYSYRGFFLVEFRQFKAATFAWWAPPAAPECSRGGRPLRRLCALPVNISPMPDLRYLDLFSHIIDLVNGAIITLTHTPQLLFANQFL